jgi:hypothetical protein
MTKERRADMWFTYAALVFGILAGVEIGWGLHGAIGQ